MSDIDSDEDAVSILREDLPIKPGMFVSGW